MKLKELLFILYGHINIFDTDKKSIYQGKCGTLKTTDEIDLILSKYGNREVFIIHNQKDRIDIGIFKEGKYEA